MSYDKYLKIAIERSKGLKPGTEFFLKDLFEGVEWSKLANGERRELGRLFRNQVNLNNVEKVRYCKKAQNNSTLYIKE